MKQRSLFAVAPTKPAREPKEKTVQVKTPRIPKTSIMNGSRVYSPIHDKIRQRRLQMLIHSCLYYELNTSIISDYQFDQWGRELVKLQLEYPEESKEVEWYTEFIGWDATTGYHLPTRDPWVMSTARLLLQCHNGGR